MDGHADVDGRVRQRVALHRLDDAGNRLGRTRKAALVFTQRALRKTRAHVQRGQEREANARAPRCTHQGQRHLGGFAIRRAAQRVVQVMEFADLGVAPGQ